MNFSYFDLTGLNVLRYVNYGRNKKQ